MKPLDQWAELGRELHALDPERFERFIAEARRVVQARPALTVINGGLLARPKEASR